jgi:acetyl esterase
LLDPQVRRALEILAAEPAADGVAEARARYERLAPRLAGPVEAVASVRDGDGVRVYEPAGARGTVVFCHGGGWVLGSLDSHDAVCRALAARAGVRVVAVDYRRSPEHVFPAALEDAERALGWARSEFGGPLAVAGDSSGGALAAMLAQRDRSLAAQVLVYPALDAAARDDADPACGLTRADMDAFWGQYAPGDLAGAASPGAAADVSGLAPALFVLAECDPLRAEAERYAARLDRARVVVVPGTAHGFLRWGGVAPDVADAGLDACAAALRDAR